MLLFSPFSGRLLRVFSVGRLVSIGMGVASGCMILLASLQGVHKVAISMILGIGVYGIGVAVAQPPLTGWVVSLGGEAAGTASGIVNLMSRSGSLLGVAVLPSAVGLSGEKYHEVSGVSTSFPLAMITCAIVLVCASLLSGVLAWTEKRQITQRGVVQ